MPRRARVFVSGAVYHVCWRVARRESLFPDACEVAASAHQHRCAAEGRGSVTAARYAR